MVIRSARVTVARDFDRNLKGFNFNFSGLHANFLYFNFRLLFSNGNRNATFFDFYLNSVLINLDLIRLRVDSSILTCISVDSISKRSFGYDPYVRAFARGRLKSKVQVFRRTFVVFEQASEKCSTFTSANRGHFFTNASSWLLSINAGHRAYFNSRLSAIFNGNYGKEYISSFQISQRLRNFGCVASYRISDNYRLRERIGVHFQYKGRNVSGLFSVSTYRMIYFRFIANRHFRAYFINFSRNTNSSVEQRIASARRRRLCRQSISA